jgi:hypothetical protein
MSVYTIVVTDSTYTEFGVPIPKVITDPTYNEVLLGSPLTGIKTARTKFDMSGFDSVGGTKVYWTSYDTPNEAPTVTDPALVGTLQFPHVVNESIV